MTMRRITLTVSLAVCGLVAILAVLAWYSSQGEESWEGDYYQGFYPLYYYGWYYDPDAEPWRMVATSAFSEGTVYEDYYYTVGHAEIRAFDDEVVRGKLETGLVRARFRAQNCGQAVDEEDDSGWWDTGRR